MFSDVLCTVIGCVAGMGLGASVSSIVAACDKKQEAGVPAAAGVLPIPVCFHVLPGVMGELEGAGIGAGEVVKGGDVDGGFDDGCGAKGCGEWCVGVKVAIRGVVKEGECFVGLAVRSFEDAFYFFLCEPSKPDESAGLFEYAVRVAQKFNKYAGCGEDAEEINPVHVFVAVCPQLDELRRKAGRDMEKYPGYADSGCELFVGEEFFEFIEEGKLGYVHGDSVTVLG